MSLANWSPNDTTERLTSLIASGSHKLLSGMSILAYNGGVVIAMKGKDCVAIAADKRMGVRGHTISMNFQKIFGESAVVRRRAAF